MYLKYEKPIIRATIYYYDIQYYSITAEKVVSVLEKHNMFPPEKIYADKLTKRKFLSSDDNTRDLFVKAYNEKDIFEVDMASGNSTKCANFWRINWEFTFYKNSKLAVSSPRFLPWNIFTIDCTYGFLKDSLNYTNFINCIKALIEILNPFYACIDDVDNRVNLMDRVGAKTFIPHKIQQIYWGNYWGENFCKQYDVNQLRSLSSVKMESLGNGILFFLTDSIFDFDTLECEMNRKKIKMYMHSI